MEQTKAFKYRRNYLLLVMEGSFFMAGVGFFNSSTVIPVFIDTVTHSTLLVGLALTCGSFFTYFGRLLIGPFMPKVKNHARFATLIMFICRPQMLIPALFVLTGHYIAAVFALIYAYSVLWAADGLLVPAWSEVLANTVDEERHGRLLGMQMLIGGFAAVGAGALVNLFLSDPHIDTCHAFGWIFLFGGLMFTISCFMMANTENAPRPYQEGKTDFIGYYRRLPKYLKIEKDNTRVLLLQVVQMFAGMCIPFVILFAGNTIGVGKNVSAAYILIQSVGIPLGGWFWGQICDKLGCVTGMKLSGVNVLLIALVPFAAFLKVGNLPVIALAVAMFLTGINNGVYTCGYLYTVQAVRPQSRSACLVLTSLVTLPATFSSYLAGFISDKFSFTALFVVCIVFSLLSILMAFHIRPIREVTAEWQKETPDGAGSDQAG